MRKLVLAFSSYYFLLFCLPASIVHAQTSKTLPGDQSLLALAEKYVKTPITKSVSANGEVFLQRDMSAYLQTNVFVAPEVRQAEVDHGHDHKDAMLRTFLNRPHPNVATMNKYFEDAAAAFKVPVSLLKATAQVQSNWAQVSESMYGSWGTMGIIENQFVQQISKAASLLHVSASDIKNDAKTNIRAAAALLSFYQSTKPTPVTITDWFDAVKSLTGLRDEAMSHELAVRIYDLLKTGSKTVTLWGEIIRIDPITIDLPKNMTEPEAPVATSANRTAAVDYPGAVANFTTCNFNNRPAGSTIKYYFVHYVAVGTYQGAISWFKDCSSIVSAHYVIRNSDGEVSQVVLESNRAWSQGVTSYNDMGVGVEHEVIATNLSMWDSEPMLNAAANLCANVCNRRAIPKVRRVTNGDPGIYGHSDVTSTDCPNMTQARWTAFLTRVNSVTVSAPLLYSIANSGSGTEVKATWKANIEPTLAGYRLYYATSDALTNWALVADETTLTPTTTSLTLNAAQFKVPPTGDVHHFRLTAVVTDGTNPKVESTSGDIYSRSSNTTGPKVLIVDGFDRFGGSGSYQGSTHRFVTSYFKSLRNKASLQISSVANERVEDGTFALTSYDIVVWFVGDESSVNVVLSTNEKNAIKTFLDGGGKLIFTGSEVAFNIGRAGIISYDLAFMNNYLKSNYVNDGTSTYTPATGIAATPFEGLTIPIGIVYPEDFPDAINPVTGAISILNYNVSPNKAGVAYKGTFGAGTVPGGLVFLSFTLETAADTSITAFTGKALAYFDVNVVTIPTTNDDVATTQTGSAKHINALANDFTNGVAFDPATLTVVTNPANGNVTKDNAGNFTYTSNAAFTGSDSYRYSVQNINGEVSNISTVFVSVQTTTACNPTPPEVDNNFPKRDLRGAWVSTVFNIDWPSSRTLTTSQQQAELIRILDTLNATGINAVYLQVRPESDALYASTIEPWSYWLTNSQGTAPNPFWDPLAFAVSAAHARGMELHAWLNPYRAKQGTPTLAPNHVVNVRPEWTFTAGTLTMLNPGLPMVRNYLTQIIGDIAGRYNVDGIHFDDYFYPSSGLTNQDSAAYANHNPTGIPNISDWRRNSVNLMIAKVYDTISIINAASNKNVIFGVSPFGIWKSGTPAGITGNSSFNAMFCDPIAWLQAGKVDYIAPQLYWKISGPQDYNALSKWWNDQGVTHNRYVYPGLAIYRMADASNWEPADIENQVVLNRDQIREQVRGQILFSTKQIMTNVKGIKTSFQTNQFRYKSFPAAMPWKDAVCPNPPTNVRRDADTLRWNVPAPASDGDLPKKYVVYRFATIAESITHINDGRKVHAIVQANKLAITPADIASNNYFMVTSLDKNNNESTTGAGTILPVTGLTFNVKLSGNTTSVTWSTLTEFNTKHFEVERSVDGSTFKQVATVLAAGTSNARRDYSINDFLQAEGTYYYRLKTLDKDGRTNYTAIKNVVYRLAGGNIVLGPNPFVSTLNISNMHQVQRIDIMDASGRIVITKLITNQQAIQIEAPALPAGLYNLKVTKSNGGHSIIKLVKL